MEKLAAKRWARGVALPLALGLGGCGGGSGPQAAAPAAAPDAPGAAGTLTVQLVPDGLAPALSQLNLVLQGLDIEVDGAWRPVPLDALALRGGAIPAAQPMNVLALTLDSPPLATGVAWPAGTYERFRLTLGAGSTVQLSSDSSGTNDPLSVQGVLISSMGLPGSIQVKPSTTTRFCIAMDVNSVVSEDPLNPGTYVLEPGPVRGYDLGATGSISGTLSPVVTVPPADNPVILAGVTVTAQLLEPSSANSSMLTFRTVQTDSQGSYKLDLLPLGYTWCVVSQPIVAAQPATDVQPATAALAYEAKAGQGVSLGLAPSNAATRNLLFAPVAATGALNGTVALTAAAGELDGVDLVQTFSFAGVPASFVVQSAPVVLPVVTPTPPSAAPLSRAAFSAASPATFAFPVAPPGTYQAVLNRYTYSSLNGISLQRTPTAPFRIKAGEVTVITF